MDRVGHHRGVAAGPSSRRYLIGLTGNIATGKSLVMSMLRRLGAYTIDADEVAHQVLESQEPVKEAIRQSFGPKVFNSRGDIDRRSLGEIVFRDPKALQRLESLVHPPVVRAVDELIAHAEERVVAVEAIKLIETGMYRNYDALWVVISSVQNQIERLVAQRGLSETEARVRIAAQPPQNEKTALADVVIDNNGSVQHVEQQVVVEWEKIERQMVQSTKEEESSWTRE